MKLHFPQVNTLEMGTCFVIVAFLKNIANKHKTTLEKALIEMYLAGGVSVRRVEDITEALWGGKKYTNMKRLKNPLADIDSAIS